MRNLTKRTKRIASNTPRKDEMGCSSLMSEVLSKMANRDGILIRWAGGWWTYPGCSSQKQSYQGLPMPDWSARGTTIHGLIKRGEVVVAERDGLTGFPVRVRLKDRADGK